MINKIKRAFCCFLLFISFTFQAFANFEDYLTELNGTSGYSMSDRTKTRLRSYNNDNNKTKQIHGAPLDQKHNMFNSIKKNLISDWEHYTKRKWPKYKKSTDNRNKGDKYDAHHIIPQSHNGPNMWWNLFPLRQDTHHQFHSNDNECSNLFPKSKGNRYKK